MNTELNGITIHYEERGDSHGLPVVFIHGFPFSHEMWKPQMDALPGGIRAIAYDVRGHGRSGVGDGHYTIEFFVDDLVSLLDRLGIDRAVLCGLSMGGYIALRAMERQPERVRALVLCDTRSEADSDEAKIKRSATMRTVISDGVAPFAEDFLKTVFTPETFRSNPAAVETIRTIIRNTSPAAICGTLLALASRTDTTRSLGAIRVPTLIICGESDVLTPPSAHEELHGRIAGSSLFKLPRSGHLSNLENAGAFNDHLFPFLKNLK